MISYITTAIPYVNARPHLGHALELVQADVLARHRRHRGHQVRLLTGTDDNALKNVTAARAAGVPVADFVRRNGDAFVALADALAVSYDDLIRTGSDPRHRPGVERLWNSVRPDLTRRRYDGLYCPGCEQFYRPAELVDGRCPEHGLVPETVSEENWFFALSRYGRRLQQLITAGEVIIQPDHRRAEVLAFLRSGLEDISISRVRDRTADGRSEDWGIAVPGDDHQTIYVWWDALANYITAAGYGTDPDGYRRRWCDADERVHVIGKGILRFHAVIWLATLLAAGEPLPTRIAVHEYLQSAGRKIAKSAGPAAGATPEELLAAYGRDAVRWWLISDVNRGGDTDFTVDRLRSRYTEDLVNTIGNLVNRTVTLTRRTFGELLPDVSRPESARRPAATTGTPGTAELDRAVSAADRLPGRIDAALDDFDLRSAATAVTRAAADANAAVEATAPWRYTPSYPAEREVLAGVLAELLRVCRRIADELTIFLPDGAARLRTALGDGPTVGVPVPAFPRLP